jgi:hypothetical protein
MIFDIDEILDDELGTHSHRGNEGLQTNPLSDSHPGSNPNKTWIMQPEGSLKDTPVICCCN